MSMVRYQTAQEADPASLPVAAVPEQPVILVAAQEQAAVQVAIPVADQAAIPAADQVAIPAADQVISIRLYIIRSSLHWAAESTVRMPCFQRQ